MPNLIKCSWPPEQYYAWVLFHGLGLNSKQLIIDYSQFLCHYCTRISCSRTLLQIAGVVTGLVVTFSSSGGVQSTFQYQKHYSIGMTALVRHQLCISMLNICDVTNTEYLLSRSGLQSSQRAVDYHQGMCAILHPQGCCAILVIDVFSRLLSWVDCWLPPSFGTCMVSSAIGIYFLLLGVDNSNGLCFGTLGKSWQTTQKRASYV